jgi:hypothetical protein
LSRSADFSRDFSSKKIFSEGHLMAIDTQPLPEVRKRFFDDSEQGWRLEERMQEVILN